MENNVNTSQETSSVNKSREVKSRLFPLLSLISGSCGLILSGLVLLSSIFSILGILLGISGLSLGIMSLVKKTPKEWMNIVGISFGGIAIVFGLLLLFIFGE